MGLLPDLSIVIVSYNTKDLTRKCLKSIERYSDRIDYEIIVVDNGSKDGSPDMVDKDFPNVDLIRLPENRGFAGGNIPGMKSARGRYVLLLNSDTFFSEGVLKKTISYMDNNPGAGVLGCKLTNPDGTMQASARMLPGPLNKILHITGLTAHFPKSRFFGRVDFSWWDHSEPRNVGWVVGAFFLIRKKVMEEIGYLDDRYFLYFEEIDFCLRARRAGWNIVFFPYAQVIHLGGQSSSDRRKDPSRSMQINSIRITSEFRYYRKLYNLLYVLLSASIEFFWSMIVYLKNSINFSEKGIYKRSEAITNMKLIVSTLIRDRFGKGREKH